MDEDQGLDGGLKHTQSTESPCRDETRDGNKLSQNQQLLWSCFADITRSLDQKMAKKYLSTNKTADNSHIRKSPYNALQAQS